MQKGSLFPAVGAFFVCFATGAALSIAFGLESKNWVPAGFTVSSMVAYFGYLAGRKT